MDELLVTELIFDGVFNDLSEKECVAFLAPLISTRVTSYAKPSQKKENKPNLTKNLQKAYDTLRDKCAVLCQVFVFFFAYFFIANCKNVKKWQNKTERVREKCKK